MTAGSQLTDWLALLETLSPHEIDLGLERVHAVLGKLDLKTPQFVLHVAGTNGKGSSVAMLQSLLVESGVSVGAYTSPHVFRFNERICIDAAQASDEQIVAAFEHVEAVRGDVPLTYFEFGTLAALVVFDKAGVDAVILEVGMGGRLDAVNAVEPDAGLITNVSLDHCDWLGNDIDSIAFEKAGIMRKGKPIVFGVADVPASLARHASDIGAEMIVAGRDYTWAGAADGSWSWQGRRTQLASLRPPSLAGDFQIDNAAGVLALAEAAGWESFLQTDVVNAAFARPRLDGRLQIVRTNVEWLLDVAHNPAAAGVLASSMRARATRGKTIAIVAMLDDKDVAGVIAPLRDIVEHWIAVTADSPRAIEAGELARQIANLNDAGCLSADSLQQAMDSARALATPEDRILVTGSFYIVGPALRSLELYSRGS
ncbi:MAG: bifunctional tetrahydrofolate synthase/dihydrofolate synthase [Woeseiaceae bacterium]